MIRRWTVLAAALALSGCDTYHYLAGTIHEDARRPVQALDHYEAFVSRSPKDPRGCEVRLRAAELYRRTFGRCEEARRHYEAAARGFPRQRECAARARAGLLVCPDYFPLDPGRTWVYVDSASGGLAMRQTLEARGTAAARGASGELTTALYAGNRRIQSGVEKYVKEDWAVWRVDGGRREPILRYPYTEGQTWDLKRAGVRVDYLVVSSSMAVAARAGRFSACLKVREKDSRFATAWRYDYYCPGVGRVKTTVGGPGFENPNAELLRFGKIDGP